MYMHVKMNVHVIPQLFTKFNMLASQYDPPQDDHHPLPARALRYHILCEL